VLQEDLFEIIDHLCKLNRFEVIEKRIEPDHVYLFLSVPPKYSPAEVMRIIKGEGAQRLMRKHEALLSNHWGTHLWAKGYFVCTDGTVKGKIDKYVKEMEEKAKKERQQSLWE
jgi:putative transposase